MRIKESDVFPVRKRCRACRQYFGFVVIRGRFCSWQCAGMAIPSQDPADWPREHFKMIKGERVAKTAYMHAQEAQDRITPKMRGRGGRALEVYPCTYCGMWHVGTVMRDTGV